MRVLNIASVRPDKGIALNSSSTIALGSYPNQLTIPVTHLTVGAKWLSHATPYHIDDELVLKALPDTDSETSDFCIATLPFIPAGCDVDPSTFFEVGAGVTILASRAEDAMLGSSRYWYLLCKVPIGEVIRYAWKNETRQFLVLPDFKVLENDKIGTPIPPERLEALTRAIDDGSATPV